MSSNAAPSDDARDLAQQAVARQTTHEAICELRHGHLRSDIAEIKDQQAAFNKESRDYRHAMRNDLQSLRDANTLVVKEAVAAGVSSAVAAVTPLITAVADKAAGTDKLVKRLLWGAVTIGVALLAFFIIQTLVLWGLPIHPVG